MIGNPTIQAPVPKVERSAIPKRDNTPVEKSFEKYVDQSSKPTENTKLTRFYETTKSSPVESKESDKKPNEAEPLQDQKNTQETPSTQFLPPILAILTGKLDQLSPEINTENLVELITTSPLIEKALQSDIGMVMNEARPITEQLSLLGFNPIQANELVQRLQIPLDKPVSLNEVCQQLNLNTSRIRSELGILKSQLKAGDISSYLVRTEKLSAQKTPLIKDSPKPMIDISYINPEPESKFKLDSELESESEPKTKSDSENNNELLAASASLSHTINHFEPSIPLDEAEYVSMESETPSLTDVPVISERAITEYPIPEEKPLQQNAPSLLHADLRTSGRISNEVAIHKPLSNDRSEDLLTLLHGNSFPSEPISSDSLYNRPFESPMTINQTTTPQRLAMSPNMQTSLSNQILEKRHRPEGESSDLSMLLPLNDSEYQVDRKDSLHFTNNPFESEAETGSGLELEFDHSEAMTESLTDTSLEQFLEPQTENTIDISSPTINNHKAEVTSQKSLMPIDLRQATPENIQKMMDKIVEKTQISVFEGGGHAKMEISPEHLGKLSIDVEVVDSHVRVNVTVDNAEVRKLVEQNMDRLKEALASSNMNFDGLDVSVGGRDRQFYQDQQGRQPVATNESFSLESENSKKIGKATLHQKISSKHQLYKLDNQTGQVSIRA